TRFKESAKWRELATSGATGEAPVTGVTFYDATAFAASAKPAKRLPTTQEYDRALSVLRESGSRHIWILGTTPKSIDKTAEEEKSNDAGAPVKESPLPTRTAMPWFFLPDNEA